MSNDPKAPPSVVKPAESVQPPAAAEGVSPNEVDVGVNRHIEGMLELDPETMDPAYKYKFVKDDRLRVARHRMRGYRPVQLTKGGVRPLVEIGESDDGIIRVGDTILMQAPRSKAERHLSEARDLATRRLGSAAQPVKEKGRKKGIEVFEGNKYDKEA